VVVRRFAIVQRLLQLVEHELGVHRAALPPAHNAPAEHVHHECHVDPSLPGRDIGEVRDLELVGPLGTELPIDLVQRAWRLGIRNGGPHRLAAAHALQPELAHQALDGATCHRNTFAVELAPDLLDAIDLVVGLPDALHLRQQLCIALGSQRAHGRVALTRGMAPVRRWGDSQDAADRLDPTLLAVLVDECLQDLMRRSSSA